MKNKTDILETELSTFSIVCFTGTWLDQRTHDNDMKMDSYKLRFRRNRHGDNHGGIYFYVKENIYAKRRSDLELQDTECMQSEVLLNHIKVLLGTFYRPPNSPRLMD